MKAKRYAVSVQYGAGHHFFMGYHDALPEAVDQAVVIGETRIKDYDNRKGRRGVRPRVMVWEQVDVTTALNYEGPDEGKPETLVAPDVEVLNGSEFMERPSAREDNPKPAHHVTLEVIADGALAGNS